MAKGSDSAAVVTSTREGWLAGHSIVNGVLAADCLYDEECLMNHQQFREELAEFIKSKVSPAQVENLICVLNECQRDENWTDGVRRW